MSKNNTVQTENLNNGQWPDLFGFDETPASAEVSYFVIEADSNYYSTQRQLEAEANRKFLDRSAAQSISGSTLASNFFLNTAKKTRTTSNGYLTGSLIDKFRQGVELNQVSHWSSGFYKISAGTPGHLIAPVNFGINESYNVTSNDYFEELSLFNPIEFIALQDTDKPIDEIITFPIVTSDANQRENYVLNGVIEPFPIRPIISQFSINFPFEPHGVVANFGNGNPFMRSSSDNVSQIYDFDPLRINQKVFLDNGDPIVITDENGNTSLEMGPNLAYISWDQNVNEPFEDSIPSRGDELESTRQYESDLLAAVRAMRPLNTTYLTANQVSSRTGFTYDNALQGVDSIAYGGLLR